MHLYCRVKLLKFLRMRKYYLIFGCLFYGGILAAQELPANLSFKTALAAVIGDYPNQFKNLMGDLQEENPQSADYFSRFTIKEAIENHFTRYSATGKVIFSWEALQSRTDRFSEAAHQFKSLFRSINNLSVAMNGTNYTLKGTYSLPSEEKKFTSIVLKPYAGNQAPVKLRVELLLQLEMLEWTVRVLVYEKEREDDERGFPIE